RAPGYDLEHASITPLLGPAPKIGAHSFKQVGPDAGRAIRVNGERARDNNPGTLRAPARRGDESHRLPARIRAEGEDLLGRDLERGALHRDRARDHGERTEQPRPGP